MGINLQHSKPAGGEKGPRCREQQGLAVLDYQTITYLLVPLPVGTQSTKREVVEALITSAGSHFRQSGTNLCMWVGNAVRSFI